MTAVRTQETINDRREERWERGCSAGSYDNAGISEVVYKWFWSVKASLGIVYRPKYREFLDGLLAEGLSKAV